MLTLYHRLSSKQIKRLMEAVLVANELNFGQTKIVKDENDVGRYYVELTSKTKIKHSFISRESLLLNALAEAFGCDYHGWGVQRWDL